MSLFANIAVLLGETVHSMASLAECYLNTIYFDSFKDQLKIHYLITYTREKLAYTIKILHNRKIERHYRPSR